MDFLPGLIGLLTVAAITPGPNNLIIMSLASRRGLVSVMPFMGGIVFGGVLLLCFVWAGAGLLFMHHPGLRNVCTLIGVAYLMFMGCSMMVSETEGPSPGHHLPSSCFGLIAFQLINPKAWVLTLTVTASSGREFEGVRLLAILVILFSLISGLCLMVWAVMGAGFYQKFKGEKAGSWVSRGMGLLLAGSALLLL